MLITISEIRQHLRLDPLDTNLSEFDIKENDYLQNLYLAAVDYVNAYLEYNIEENPTSTGRGILNCVLLLIADLYENREAQTEKQLYNNDLVNRILQLHRKNIGI